MIDVAFLSLKKPKKGRVITMAFPIAGTGRSSLGSSVSVSIKRLGVTIADADGVELAPKGFHLRWFFPKSLGFPAKGCEIFRISYEQWRRAMDENNLLREADLGVSIGTGTPASGLGVANWSGRDRRLQVHPDLDLVFRSVTEFAQAGGTLKLVKSGGARNLLLQFRNPIMYLRVEMPLQATAADPELRVTGFHHSAPLAELPLGEIIELEQPGITDVLIPLAFERVKRILFVRETDLIDAVITKKIGSPVHTLKLPQSANDAYDLLKPDVVAGIANRMLNTHAMTDAKGRYRPEAVSRLVHHLNLSVGNPDLTVTAPETAGRSSFPVRVLDHLHLAALDPNIARMLISYWVDGSPGDFLYMVAAYYAPSKTLIGYGFAFTRNAASTPKIHEPVTARQLPGIDYRNTRPHGRVGLLWDRENGDYRNPAKPVFVDVERRLDGHSELLTKDAPALIGSGTGQCFRDSLPAGVKVRYGITPIDIFGRRGPGINSDIVEVGDLEAPVAPKQIRAIIEQNGFPWQEPARRKDPYIRQGELRATAEFGEAQRRASPDAAKIRWRWRAGPLPENSTSPADWTLLATENLSPPLQGKLAWTPGDLPTEFKLPVKEVRPVGTIETQRIAERISPIFTRASDLTPDAAHAESGLLEIIIDRPLLEPGLFDGYRIVTGQGDVPVMGTHAGIAAGTDNFRLMRAARLVVAQSPASGTILPGDTITLRNPFHLNEAAIQTMLKNPGTTHVEMPTPLVRVRLQKAPGTVHMKAVGGEVAIDYHYLAIAGTETASAKIHPVDAAVVNAHKRETIIVGRLVSDLKSDGSSSTFILRLKPADFLRVMLIGAYNQQITTTARFHAPNVLPTQTIGINGAGGDIQLFMPPGKRFTAIYLTATTVDTGGKESGRVAAPFEMRVVNPPPVAVPEAPYPSAGGKLALYGEASPPDYSGRSTVRIAWDGIASDSASPHAVRYELGRSLDTGIIASDRNRWLRGDSTDHFAGLGITVTPETQGRLRAGIIADPGRGNFRVVLKDLDTPGGNDPAGLKGRIRITHTFHDPQGNGVFETQITHRLLKTVVSGGETTFLCRPFFELEEGSLGEIQDGAAFTAQTAPDYSAVLSDDNRLRQLADLRYTGGPLEGEGRNESAFGVVTGMPVAGTEFVDTIPGIGRNRFFYKVRAVFPGEIRSAWSSVSVAFRQADLSKAELPEILQMRCGATGIAVTLTRPSGPGIRGFRVLKKTPGGTSVELATFVFVPRDGEMPLEPAPLRSAGRLVDLRLLLVEARAEFGGEPELLGIYEASVDRESPPAGSNLLTDDARRVRDLVELPEVHPTEVALAAQISVNGTVRWLTRIETRVELQVDDVTGPEEELFIQTVKEIVFQGRTVLLDSEPIRLGGAS
jgi:hypothetical protein